MSECSDVELCEPTAIRRRLENQIPRAARLVSSEHDTRASGIAPRLRFSCRSRFVRDLAHEVVRIQHTRHAENLYVLLGGLKRRDIFKVAIAYLVASWLIVQVVDVLTDPLGLPDVLETIVVVLLAIGFPFALIIAWVYEVTPQGIKLTADTDTARQVTSLPAQKLTYVVIVLLVMVVGIMVLDRYVLAPSSGDFSAGSRIAVLPCDDFSPDPTNSFFAVGIHGKLLNRLAALNRLEVISRASVQRYAGARPPVPQIAAELNVVAIIECSARYAGDCVLLTAQLVDAVSDTHLWSQAYPADMSDLQSLFDIQAEIAMNVENTLRIEFFDEEREQLERVPTRSRDAYEFYLAALEVVRSIIVEAMSRRLELVDAAIE